MKELTYSFLGFAHQLPLRTSKLGINLYNGELVDSYSYMPSSFVSSNSNILKVSFSGQKKFEVLLPLETTFYSPSTYSVSCIANGFRIIDANHEVIEVPYIICNGSNLIAGPYVFEKHLFPPFFDKPGTWSVEVPSEILPEMWTKTLKSLSRLPETNICFDDNKVKILSFLSATGLNIAKWLSLFSDYFEDEHEKTERIDNAITPIVSLLVKRLTNQQKILLIIKLDEEGLPDECSEVGTRFDFLVDSWIRILFWNIIYDFTAFHEPTFRYQKAIPFDFGGRLLNQYMPKFY